MIELISELINLPISPYSPFKGIPDCLLWQPAFLAAGLLSLVSAVSARVSKLLWSDCLTRLPTLMGSYWELIRIWRILSQMRVKRFRPFFGLTRIWLIPLRIPWATWAGEEYPAHPRLSVMMRKSNWFSPSFWFDSDLIQFESSPSQCVQPQLVIWLAFDSHPFGFPELRGRQGSTLGTVQFCSRVALP